MFIGVDPDKLSVTTEVVDDREMVLATGRFSTDKAGHAAMLREVAAWPERTWAVGGSNGAGRPLAQRVLSYEVEQDITALQLMRWSKSGAPR